MTTCREPPTEGITVSDFCSPTAHEVHVVVFRLGHSGIPSPNQVHVFVNLVRLDGMEDDRMHIFPSCKHLREALLNLLVHLLPLAGAINQAR